MKEVLSSNETPQLEEVIRQRDDFFRKAQTLQDIFVAEDGASIKARGRVELTWRVPVGYEIQVFALDSSKFYATTMFRHREYDSGRTNDDTFDISRPLAIHSIRAVPDTYVPIQYDLTSKVEGDTYQSFTIRGDHISEFAFVPTETEQSAV